MAAMLAFWNSSVPATEYVPPIRVVPEKLLNKPAIFRTLPLFAINLPVFVKPKVASGAMVRGLVELARMMPEFVMPIGFESPMLPTRSR